MGFCQLNFERGEDLNQEQRKEAESLAHQALELMKGKGFTYHEVTDILKRAVMISYTLRPPYSSPDDLFK